jgi:hypothetical protein
MLTRNGIWLLEERRHLLRMCGFDTNVITECTDERH